MGTRFNLDNNYCTVSYNKLYVFIQDVVRTMKRKRLKKTVRQNTAIFEPDEEKGGYTVTIPSLPGCISEGDTFEEALHNIQEAASLYVDVKLTQG